MPTLSFFLHDLYLENQVINLYRHAAVSVSNMQCVFCVYCFCQPCDYKERDEHELLQFCFIYFFFFCCLKTKINLRLLYKFCFHLTENVIRTVEWCRGEEFLFIAVITWNTLILCVSKIQSSLLLNLAVHIVTTAL